MERAKAVAAKFWSWPWKAKAPILIVLAIVIIGPFAGGGGDDPEVTTASADTEASATNPPDPTEEPEPTNTPDPTATAEPTVDPSVAAEATYRLSMAAELREFSTRSTAFGELTSDGGDFGNPAWEADVNEAADNIIAVARRMRDMDAPSAQWEAYEGKLDPAMDLLIDSLTLFKAGMAASNADVILQSVERLTSANQLFSEAVTLIPQP